MIGPVPNKKYSEIINHASKKDVHFLKYLIYVRFLKYPIYVSRNKGRG